MQRLETRPYLRACGAQWATGGTGWHWAALGGTGRHWAALGGHIADFSQHVLATVPRPWVALGDGGDGSQQNLGQPNLALLVAFLLGGLALFLQLVLLSLSLGPGGWVIMREIDIDGEGIIHWNN